MSAQKVSFETTDERFSAPKPISRLGLSELRPSARRIPHIPHYGFTELSRPPTYLVTQHPNNSNPSKSLIASPSKSKNTLTSGGRARDGFRKIADGEVEIAFAEISAGAAGDTLTDAGGILVDAGGIDPEVDGGGEIGDGAFIVAGAVVCVAAPPIEGGEKFARQGVAR